MTNVIKKATNKFNKGLIMDFSPENTKNEVLTHALNATLLTFNGNELSLQNDMGNARVETAYLPEGYIPVGTCEYGGIIYIVSYNPLEDKSQIGCFPSPERNISNDELGMPNAQIDAADFINDGTINNTSKYVLLKQDNLNPGDKFVIYANDAMYEEKLLDLTKNGNLVEHPVLALNVVSIEDSGKIVYLNSDLIKYDKNYNNNDYKYHILGEHHENKNTKINLDSYRNVLSSGYNVFRSKTSGKLAILAELVMIDSYSVTHSIQSTNRIGKFDIMLHTEVEPSVTAANYSTVPKLKYYYLENSQGYLQIDPDSGNDSVSLFNEGVKSDTFGETRLDAIYEPISTDIDLSSTIGNDGKFNFPAKGSYHGKMIASNDIVDYTYTKFYEGCFHRINFSQIKEKKKYWKAQVGAKFYAYSETENYELTSGKLDEDLQYYVKQTTDSYTYVDPENISTDETLYKNPYTVILDDKIKNDPSIQKYELKSKIIYQLVNSEEANAHKQNGGLVYQKITDDEYQQIEGNLPDDVDLYIEIKEKKYEKVDHTKLEKDKNYYYLNTERYIQASSSDKENYQFNTDEDFKLYRKKENISYVEATAEDISNYEKGKCELYHTNNYTQITLWEDLSSISNLVVVVPIDVYVPKETFEPNEYDNYILGDFSKPYPEYVGESPISLHNVADFIPEEFKETAYEDIKLANITIPKVIVNNGLDLPFKYDYTIVPCMNYGRLDHLAVSNTVDFSKLHAFNQSDFTTWKYHIDGNQLRLTFGADIYDTYETYKVDGLILEFYDLWGFAGSLEISNKKSYSGIFTKIISLNTLHALSSKNRLGVNYKHNINIQKIDEDTYTCGNVSTYFDSENGWSISDDDNDCGTLYSNILYGVKTYLRRTKGDGTKEFIPKSEFFLYTLPLYNDFYYTVNNFNNLSNPQLDFMLTYKLTDSSEVVEFTGDGVDSGYLEADKNNIIKYLSGIYEDDSLDITKYYKYEGTSDLYLEVGLKADYQEINLSYDPKLNEFFTCTLKLVSNNSDTRTVTAEADGKSTESESQILQYPSDENSSFNIDNLNTLTFDEGTELTVKSIAPYNFITANSENPIKLSYSFVVGYRALIDNIKPTQVPATTVCALYHKNTEGEYNMEDFGVYFQDGQYLSSAMMYNGGTAKQEVFGLCRQINTTGGTMAEQCQSVIEVTTDAKPNSLPRKLNTGDPLKQISQYIGKLTFCQPHAHAIYEGNGVNIVPTSDGFLGISPVRVDSWDVFAGSGETEDVCWGSIPSLALYKNPCYNLSLNTKNSLTYYSEFLSTMNFVEDQKGHLYGSDLKKSYRKTDADTYPMAVYTGVSGTFIADFNKAMLNTMSDVYAYNPDYDSLLVSLGDVHFDNLNVKFTSNLVCIGSNFDFKDKSLNDYIYIGSVCFSTYLQQLNKYSEITIKKETEDGKETYLPHVQLMPSYTYCGTPESWYLVSSLTYNTPTPQSFKDELEFKSQDTIVVKDSEGINHFLKGDLNKKALYYFNDDDEKLIQLDVSNYTIDSNGTLKLTDAVTLSSKSYTLESEVNTIFEQKSEESKEYEVDDTTFTIKYKFYDSHVKFYDENDGTYFCSIYNEGITTELQIDFEITNKDVSEDDIQIINIESECYAAKISAIGPGGGTFSPSLGGCKDAINKAQMEGSVVTSINNNNCKLIIRINDNKAKAVSDVELDNGETNSGGDLNNGATIDIFKLKITKIEIRVNKTINIENTSDQIININPTVDYASIDTSTQTYKVNYPNCCLVNTTLTLNDLMYEPNINGHRLFVKNLKTEYFGMRKGSGAITREIFYRDLYDKNSWHKDYTYYNHLYLLCGPCFTDDLVKCEDTEDIFSETFKRNNE